jgi:hypothetical protein
MSNYDPYTPRKNRRGTKQTFAERTMTPERIIAEIENAFAEVRRGNGITLHETDVVDACGSARERAKARKRDTDERWQDVPDDDIESHQSALCFLDPEGFRYYLPAYMRWSLLHYKSSDSLASDSTIYSLGPAGNKGVTDWNRERWGVFTERQTQVILAYLRFMVEHGDGCSDNFMADLAINAYWRQFSQPATPPHSEPAARSPQR